MDTWARYRNQTRATNRKKDNNMMKVNNVPDYAYGKKYWVVLRNSVNDIWFYAATDDRKLANDIAIDRGRPAVVWDMTE